MFSVIIIFFLSVTIIQQTDGLPKSGKRMLQTPEYLSRVETNSYVYNPYENQELDYNKWGNNEEDKESFDDEETKLAESVENGVERGSRRLFEWFSRLFLSTTPRPVQTTPTTTESSYQRDLKDRIFIRTLHRNLTEVLFKLAEVEKRVSAAMLQKEPYAIITKGKPQVLGLDKSFYYRDRLKRDVSNVADAEKVTNTADNEKSVNITDKSTNVSNVNGTDCAHDNVTSGRRAGSILANTEVKNKLLLYLQESFQEIRSKIMSLKNLKQAFSDNVSFKIGYILANIDTLEVSMLNLKNNMDKNKEVWEDNKILELYDTLKVSNQAVSGLIESLKVYLEKLSYKSQTKIEPELGTV